MKTEIKLELPLILTLLPITYVRAKNYNDLINSHVMIYHVVTFTEDFGVIKKGSKFDNIEIDFREGTLETCIGDGRNDDYKLYKLKLTM